MWEEEVTAEGRRHVVSLSTKGKELVEEDLRSFVGPLLKGRGQEGREEVSEAVKLDRRRKGRRRRSKLTADDPDDLVVFEVEKFLEAVEVWRGQVDGVVDDEGARLLSMLSDLVAVANELTVTVASIEERRGGVPSEKAMTARRRRGSVVQSIIHSEGLVWTNWLRVK